MKHFLFCTDAELIISRWDHAVAEFTGRARNDAIGRKYYEVLPLISVDGSDALDLAIATGKSINLRGYVLGHSSQEGGRLLADLRISPLLSGGVACGALVAFMNAFREGHGMPRRKAASGGDGETILHRGRNCLNTLKGAITILRDGCSCGQPMAEFWNIADEEIEKLAGIISHVRGSSDAQPAVPEKRCESHIHSGG